VPSKGGSHVSRGTSASQHTSPIAAVVAEAAAVGAGRTGLSGLPVVSVEADPPVDTPEWARLYGQTVARYREDRVRQDGEAAESQALWDEFLTLQGAEIPDGETSLSNNDHLHQRLMELARTQAAGEYQLDGVIGDPNQTFGVEIEFDGADPNAVARALYDAGLCGSPNQQGYHSGGHQPGMWTVERDVTVSGEIVSPVLTDTPQSWEQLQRVCEILRQHGARVSARTGGHVHVGCDSANLDHDVERFRRIASVCSWAEDLMYRLAAGTGRGGRRHRGAGNGYRWCGPMRSGQFEDVASLSDLTYRVGASHNVGLNYGNILGTRRTIEYRYFDSSLDPVRLQNNIRLACWLTKRAAELPNSAIPQDRVPLGSHASGQSSDSSEHLLRRFADLVFVRPQDKLRLYAQYQRSAWQQLQRAA
jgi:hypothetical protein